MQLGLKNLAFIDCETTGLDIDVHEIIEIGVLIYNEREDRIIKEWDIKIAPQNIETASPISIKINGYINNPSAYKSKLQSALIKFNKLVSNCFLVGQNIAEFDLPFLYKAMNAHNIIPSFHRRDKLVLESLIWWEIKDIDISGLSLANFCELYNVSNEGSHSALVDCRRTYEVYRKLKEINDRYKKMAEVHSE